MVSMATRLCVPRRRMDGMPLSSAIISMRVRQLRPPAALSPGMRSMGTATSIWPSRLICSETVMAFHLSWPGKRDVHEIRAAHSPAHRQGTGKWPCRGDSVFRRLENLDDFAGPEPVVPVVGLVKLDSHEFVGQGEADEHHTTVDMGHAAALVGVSFDTNFSLHHRPFRLRSVRVRHQQRLQSVSS